MTYDDSDMVFAYQAGAGVAYEILPTLDLGLSYRFLVLLTQLLTMGSIKSTTSLKLITS